MASEKGLSPLAVYTLMGLMILTGSINTISNKLQNDSVSLGRKYNHVWFITFCMFFGEIFCFIVYLFNTSGGDSKKTPLVDESQIKDEEFTKELPEATPFNLIIPALCDFFGSTLMTFGLSMMAGSIYQMFRGSLIIFTAIFSVIFLKNKLYKHHFLALFFVISGLMLVGLSSELFPPDNDPECGSGGDSKTSITGIILVIIAQLFSATQFIVEEKFMKNYKCHPLKAVGWEGIWGASFYLIFLIIFQFIPCGDNWNTDLRKDICSQNEAGEYLLENSIFAFKQMGNDGKLLFYVILYIFSIALFNFVGISVTKYASSPARAVVDTIRTIFVWLFFLLPIVNKCNREHFNWLQLVGFVILVLGTVIYNEVLVLPFMGLNENIASAIKKRENIEKESLKTQRVTKEENF